LTVSVPVDLPTSKKGPVDTESVEPLVVSVNENKDIYLMDTKLQLNELPGKLKEILEEKPETKVFVRGDRKLPYGDIMEVMGTLAESGLKNVSLVALSPQGE